MAGAHLLGGRERKPYEAILVILTAISAAMSGMSGYLAAEAKKEENLARSLGLRELNLANTAYLEANQIVFVDIECLREANVYDYLALVEMDDDYTEIAHFLRNSTIMVIDGYIDYTGEGTAEYDWDYNLASAAYFEDMYASYHDHLSVSEDAAEDALHLAETSSNYLLNTVFMAFSAVLATIGMSSQSPRLRLVMVGLVIVVLSASTIFIVSTMLS